MCAHTYAHTSNLVQCGFHWSESPAAFEAELLPAVTSAGVAPWDSPAWRPHLWLSSPAAWPQLASRVHPFGVGFSATAQLSFPAL